MVPPPLSLSPPQVDPGDPGYLYFSAAVALALEVGLPVWENLISAWISLSPDLS